ncbi:hypothetical protein CH267_06880 [Rhodococcus sp. 06-621-2]|nr:hypothetical protein [Rhodococcus sp. 06-621-2]OZC59803.1 hypothetical protein CH267_06880 [Rhodococcus sp. 06-621-2]
MTDRFDPHRGRKLADGAVIAERARAIPQAGAGVAYGLHDQYRGRCRYDQNSPDKRGKTHDSRPRHARRRNDIRPADPTGRSG